jgi:hypothetical protein
MPNTYTELRRTVVGTATGTVTLDLTGISGYTDLVLVVEGIATANSTSTLSLQFNGDTASNYSGTRLSGNGSTATSDRYSTATVMGGGLITSSVRFNNIINIQNYSNTTTFKTVLFRSNVSDSLVRTSVNLWRSTAAITQIDVLATATTFASGTTLSLYGIANADQGAAKATGGIITEDSQYWYHTFGASGTFTPKQSLSCDVLVVAGGGGAGDGGGGAGGVQTLTNQTLAATGVSITVGSGGTGGTNNSSNATSGNNSVFTGYLTANGGGPGQTPNRSNYNLAGGSGGGSVDQAVAAGTASQGSAGGRGFTDSASYDMGGGGGGFSVSGGAAAAALSGSGGNGISTYSSWGLATGTGQNVSGTYWYAGGGSGGGGKVGFTGIGAAGFGGGGVGWYIGTGSGGPANGTVNTGGGGGGGTASNPGGAGGSGVVIVRYAK